MKPQGCIVIALSVAGFAALLAWSQSKSAPPARQGYLAPSEEPDTIRILPPAPQSGDARDSGDRAIFKATRSFEGSARWSLAQSDADTSVPAILKDFSCAAGLALTPQSAPHLAALLSKMSVDGIIAMDRPKEFYKRKRPFLVDDGPICLPRTDSLAKSPDYPSGHTTWGWEVGLILAELVPSHATDILVRARSYGESRLVCGVHNASAVEAGRTNASIVIAALHGSPAFRKDLDAARQEIRHLHAASGSTACSTEAATIAKSPY